MPPAPELSVQAPDAGQLTEALRCAGLLGDGSVRDVTVESSRSTILSRITRLRLSFDGDAARAPHSLILKTGLPERMTASSTGGRNEVAFFRDIAPMLNGRIVPFCVEAHWDPVTSHWHLLLEDLTDTHSLATAWPLPPTGTQCERIITVLARFHAAWWDDPRLGVTAGTWRDAAEIDRILQALAGHFATFVDSRGDDLSPERSVFYQRLIDAAPRLMQRYHSRRNVTITHGDAHVWNCFLPHDGSEDTRLFDWDGWRIGIAAADLAYMMALHWFPDRRRRFERTLLDHYHATLLNHGVSGYSRADLDDDYRRAVLWQATTPIWQAAYKIPPVIWWNHMERILLAVDDLGCRELLG